MKTKIIVMTGGVFSSLGKGIIVSSIGRLLKSHGFSVAVQKMDPYLNIDPGLLSPYQHGEVYVTDDGYESDLDLGNYERFINIKTTRFSNITSGSIYSEVLSNERKGSFNGKTIQVIPHITDAIKNRIKKHIEHAKANFLLIEIGGTIGDIESIPFMEALTQFSSEYGRDNFLFAHCTPIINFASAGEIKTKPAQHSVRELGKLGIIPDMLFLRYDTKIPENIIEKISLNCHIDKENIFSSINTNSTYFVPEMFYKQNLHTKIFKHFRIKPKKENFKKWLDFTSTIKAANKVIEVNLVGKYIELHDAYKSIVESLDFAGFKLNHKVKINWIDSSKIDKSNYESILSNNHAILIPGGFGQRGMEGKILAIKYARENKIPLFGICLGMQLSCIEFARNVLGWKDADSTEMNSQTSHKIFDFIDGHMRLGGQIIDPVKNTIFANIYGDKPFKRRHRHRYEFNMEYYDEFSNNGLVFSGFSHDKSHTVEAIEYKDHPFFVACQFHPEFTSTPYHPDELFVAFIKAAIKNEKHKN